MIKVLIMEDDSLKKDRILKVITDNCKIPVENIDWAPSVNCGRKELIVKNYDLLLLDLVMPINDGEEPDYNQSPKFIDELYSNDMINIPNHIIGFSQHDELVDRQIEKYRDKLSHLIKFDIAKNDWVTQLQNKIGHIKKTKEFFEKSILEKNKFDIGIMCALQEEFTELLNAFSVQWVNRKENGYPFDFREARLHTGNGNNLKIIACCIGKPGMSAASIVATTMYNLFDLEYLFITGFCAGFESDEVKIGDIVIAESVQDYGVGKLKDDDQGNPFLLKEIHQIPANYETITKVRSFVGNGEYSAKIHSALKKANLVGEREVPQAIIGPTVCGPFVVTSTVLMGDLKKDARKLKSLDMEGYGVYLASFILNKKSVWIKSIADLGDANKDDKYHKRCSHASASFLYWLLKDIF